MPLSPPNVELTRARPLLGTIVSIQVAHASQAMALQALEAAFAAMGQIHRAMSFQSVDSELTAMNCLAHLEPVRVSGVTWSVLRAALAMARASGGAFDPSIAGSIHVAQDGLLPRPDPTACFRDVHLLTGQHVRYTRPLWLDLSGIAKGAAVDRAVSALRAGGAFAGTVNAGGDLRVFGARPVPILVRHPDLSQPPQVLGQLTDGAVATSAGYYVQGKHVVDPLTRRALPAGRSITVVARRAIWADALTKVVHAQGPRALGLLRRLYAEALIFDISQAHPWRVQAEAA